MKRQVLILALLGGILSSLFSQQTYLEVYGQEQTDINSGNAILQLDPTTFVLGGEWNGIGFLAKVNFKGDLIDYFFLDNTISGNSAVLDMAFDPAGNIIATGECDHCVPGDTLKKVFTVATEPSLLLITSEIYEGNEPSNNQMFGPSIASKGNQLLLAASAGGGGLNFDDLALLSITANLDTLWTKTFNSCSNCGFDRVTDIVPTAAGYAVLVLNPFTDSLTLYHVDDSGDLIWKKRHPTVSGTTYSKLAYRSDVIYASGSEQIGNGSGGFIRRFSESSGNLLGSMAIDLPDVDDGTAGLQFADDGTLLAIHHRAQPNGFGTYQVSRIYRVDVATMQVLDFTEIPNPDVLTSMEAAAVVPLTDDGAEMAACGKRGFYDRSFFYSKNNEEPQPPGMGFDATPDTACAPATILLTNNFDSAISYEWELDGTVFSTEQNPPPVSVTGAGLHEIKMEAVTVSLNAIGNFTVESLPEIWNECAICDNKPDPYIVIKNPFGTVLYTSSWVESYPPVDLPVTFSMSATQSYKIEVWDRDAIGADDFFGVFTIFGNTDGGTFSLINPDDPDTPLTISFTTIPTIETETFSQMVLVYEPTATLLAGDILSAGPGNPAPPFYTWQWYLNGQPIPGATADTFSPTVGGSYAVAMVTPDCAALSNLVQFSPSLTSVNLETAMPLCFGDFSGAILATPIGGTPPYVYEWNPSDLSGDNPTNLPAGDYAVTVTDEQGQTATAQVTLVEPDPISASIDAESPACAGDSSGSILVTPTGGTGMFSYAWDPPALSGNHPVDLPEGSYTVTLTDENGCSAISALTLAAPDSLTATTESSPTGENLSIGTATVVPSGGTPPYSYSWNTVPVQTEPTATGLDHGDYSVTVTDANGCTLEASVTVELLIATHETEELGFKVYPNPTSGLVFIEMDVLFNGEAVVEIHDPTGRMLRREKVSGMPASIDMAGLPDGVFLLSVTTDGWRIVERVVVGH